MNIKHYKFVTEYLKWGDQVIAYKNAYQSNSSYKSLQSAANRLLNDPEVAKAIYESESRIRGEVEIAIANQQIKEILTIEEKRTLLKQIAAGTMYVEQKYKGKNCTQCSQYISPTINQMLAAIREDNKLAGHYPHKQNGKWVIPALQTEQQEKPSENTLDNISPLGAGGDLPQDENTNPEIPQQNTCPNDEIGRATIENQEDITSPVPVPQNCGRRGWGGSTPDKQETQDKNLQQFTTSPENEIDNQPFTDEANTHDTPTVNSSGRIISQEQLRQVLYPQKTKLTPMENNPWHDQNIINHKL